MPETLSSTWIEKLEGIQAALTSVAIVLGAIWTYLLFVSQRQKYPRAGVEHHVETRPLTGRKRLLRLTVKLKNEGSVLMSLSSLVATAFRVRPVPEQLHEDIAAGKCLVETNQTELPWPVLDGCDRTCHLSDHEIEPGEQEEFHFDFVIDDSIQTVLLHTYVKNAAKRKGGKVLPKPREIGWNHMTMYDVPNGGD